MSHNHQCLFFRAGIGFFCLWMGLTLLGCAESQPKSSPVPSPDPCTPAPSSASLEALQQENERLHQQVNTLSNLPEGIDINDLYQVTSVQLTRYTGLYDKDKDGQVDQLCVYLRPLDADGDVVKAAGNATVQLWDLSGQQSESLLKVWEIPSDQLRKKWLSSLMTVNYRMLFPIQAEWVDPTLSLTVRVLFKDFLSGQELIAQMPVEARP